MRKVHIHKIYTGSAAKVGAAIGLLNGLLFWAYTAWAQYQVAQDRIAVLGGTEPTFLDYVYPGVYIVPLAVFLSALIGLLYAKAFNMAGGVSYLSTGKKWEA